jgi:hypothetical protein
MENYIHAAKVGTFDHGICPILFERLCFHMVEDSEVRGREEPWLHMGILQGTHQVGIHPKKFRIYFKI